MWFYILSLSHSLLGSPLHSTSTIPKITCSVFINSKLAHIYHAIITVSTCVSGIMHQQCERFERHESQLSHSLYTLSSRAFVWVSRRVHMLKTIDHHLNEKFQAVNMIKCVDCVARSIVLVVFVYFFSPGICLDSELGSLAQAGAKGYCHTSRAPSPTVSIIIVKVNVCVRTFMFRG